MNPHPLFEELKRLGLPANDFAIFGSGPLYVRGLRKEIKDVDVVARGAAWERAEKLGVSQPAKSGNGHVIKLAGGLIEIFDEWGPSAWNVDELIDTADVFDGLRFVKLEHVLRWKRMLNREKDAEDIAAIEGFLEKI